MIVGALNLTNEDHALASGMTCDGEMAPRSPAVDVGAEHDIGQRLVVARCGLVVGLRLPISRVWHSPEAPSVALCMLQRRGAAQEDGGGRSRVR